MVISLSSQALCDQQTAAMKAGDYTCSTSSGSAVCTGLNNDLSAQSYEVTCKKSDGTYYIPAAVSSTANTSTANTSTLTEDQVAAANAAAAKLIADGATNTTAYGVAIVAAITALAV